MRDKGIIPSGDHSRVTKAVFSPSKEHYSCSTSGFAVLHGKIQVPSDLQPAYSLLNSVKPKIQVIIVFHNHLPNTNQQIST